MQLTANVFVETGFHGANVSYITTEEGLVMVESPYCPTDAVVWRREIESKGPVRYLINTEPHGDHFIGGFFFDTTAVAHETARQVMLAADVNEIKSTIAIIDPEGLPLVEKYRVNVPSITFSERLTLYLGRHSFHLIHMPGHTVSQIAVFVPEERVVFTGDNITCRTQGFLHEADPFAWLESLEKIGRLDVDHIVPGHGDVCGKSYLEEEASYVQGCIDAVKQAIDRGWTKDEAVDRVTLPCAYTLDEVAQQVGEELLKMSVANLYERLSR